MLVMVFFAAPTMAATDTLVVRVTNILKPKGIIDVTVYRNDSTFLSDNSWAANKDVRLDTTFTKGICDITVVLPHDEYALVVFQDINLNGKLDVNFIGYPNEPFAFSRHFHPTFRAPKFREISFQCKHPRDTLVVPLMN
jgi:uncharacterized protein (DUF2141 family)